MSWEPGRVRYLHGGFASQLRESGTGAAHLLCQAVGIELDNWIGRAFLPSKARLEPRLFKT
jgi:hypothetical protein